MSPCIRFNLRHKINYYNVHNCLFTFRFARFIEGDSHLDDSEILNYEQYAFSVNRHNNNLVSRSSDSSMDISDDDSSES